MYVTFADKVEEYVTHNARRYLAKAADRAAMAVVFAGDCRPAARKLRAVRLACLFNPWVRASKSLAARRMVG